MQMKVEALFFSELDDSTKYIKVNFQILLYKLNHYGIRGIPLTWLESYLTNRQQYVYFTNSNSTKHMVQTGVPQGSILGPLLFLIYVNDLHQISENMCPTMFADDTSFFISRPHLDEIMDTANAELDKVYQWLIQNRLSLNVKKSKYMIFNKTKTKILPNIALTINNKPIERVTQFKFLGYHLDQILKLQKKAIRIINYSGPKEHTAPLFKCHRLLPISNHYTLKCALFMFKVHHGLHPQVIINL